VAKLAPFGTITEEFYDSIFNINVKGLLFTVHAIQMTQHDIRASLYAPLRVLLYENEHGKTCVEYDRPSSLFGQFGNAKVTDVATMLDRKMEQLVAKAIE
jgi:Domain of unknown function DUF302